MSFPWESIGGRFLRILVCLKRLRHLLGPVISLKIRPFLEAEHVGDEVAREAADALVVGLGRFVETLALGEDAVLAARQLRPVHSLERWPLG